MSQPRRARSYQRKAAHRQPHTAILVVCEDQKAAPKYFKGLVARLRLPTSRVIEVTGDCGSAPSSVVQEADAKRREARADGIAYDEVYCVFDRDAHSTFASAIVDAKKRGLTPIPSVPCFELWLLLHYKYSTRPYAASKKYSVCEVLIEDLKINIPDYSKGKLDIFSATHENLDVAIENWRKLDAYNQGEETSNPSTDIGKLVLRLFEVKKDTCRERQSFAKQGSCQGDEAAATAKSCFACKV